MSEMDATTTLSATRASDKQPPEWKAVPASPETDWHVHVVVAALAAFTALCVLIYIIGASPPRLRLTDFEDEAWPAYAALIHGHVIDFVRLAPAYYGSLILRAPFAVLPSIWGGGRNAVYFASALPCIFALAAFCTWLAAQPRRQGGITWASRISPIAVCICNPLTLIALYYGHPEEALGAVLCIGAVVCAVKAKPAWAGLLVGLAVVNKSWALAAVPVVLAVMQGPRRRAILVMFLTTATVWIPATLIREHGLGTNSAAGLGATVGLNFQPPQLLWWLGPHSWIVQEARPGIILVAAVCSMVWWIRKGRLGPTNDSLSDALLLLALVMLIRAALDPQDNIYYHLPFLFALLAYETTTGRMPLLTVAATVVLVIATPVHGVAPMSDHLRAAVYAMLVVPTLVWLAAKVYLRPGSRSRVVGLRAPGPGVPSATQ